MDSFKAKVNAVTCTLLQSNAVRKECLDHHYCEDDNCLMCLLRSICPYDTTYYDVDKMKDLLGCLLKDADEKLNENADIVEVFKAMTSPSQSFNQLVEEKVCCSTCGFTVEFEPDIIREVELCIDDEDVESSVNQYFRNRPSTNCDACAGTVTHRSTKICQPPDVLAIIPSSNMGQILCSQTPISPKCKLDVSEVGNVVYGLTGAVVNVGDITSSNEFASVLFDNGCWKICASQKTTQNPSNVKVKQICVLLYDRIQDNESNQVLPMLWIDRLVNKSQSNYISRDQPEGNNGVERLTSIINDEEEETISTTVIPNENNLLLDRSVNEGLQLINGDLQSVDSQINSDKLNTSKLKLFQRDSFGKFVCPKCSEKFYMRHLFKLHLGNHYKADYVKALQNKHLSRIRKLSGRKTATVNPVLQCDSCPRTFFKSTNLERHVRNFHPNDNLLQTHDLQCSLCSHTFRSKSSLNRHISASHKRTITKQVNDRTFKCELCQNLFRIKGSLTRHIQTCHSEVYLSKTREYECIKCKKQFETNCGLKIHMAVHMKDNTNDKKRFKCKLCPSLFSSTNNLTRHVRKIHSENYLTQSAEFQCILCNESFDKYLNLRRHVSMNHQTNENNPNNSTFQCNQCSRSFNQKRSLIRHVQTIHSEARTPPIE